MSAAAAPAVGAPAPRLADPWRRHALPGLLATAARARGDAAAVRDAPDAAAWAGRPPRALTFAGLHREAERAAARLAALGLRPGEALLVALPNAVEAWAVILGAMRLGAVPALAPAAAEPGWLAEAARACGAAGIVAACAFAGLRPALAAREAAGRCAGARFVAAVGEGAPPGVARLDDEGEEARLGAPPADAALPALITFGREGGGEGVGGDEGGRLAARARTGEQLVGEALAVAALARLLPGGSLVVTLAPASAAAFAAGVAAPLIAGASALLHGPFDAGVLARQRAAAPGAALLLPAAVGEALARGEPPGAAAPGCLVLLHRAPGPRAPLPEGARAVDLLAPGELLVLPLLRRPGGAVPRRPRHPAPGAIEGGAPFAVLGAAADGALSVAGFAAARALGAGGLAGGEAAGWRAAPAGEHDLRLGAPEGAASPDAPPGP